MGCGGVARVGDGQFVVRGWVRSALPLTMSVLRREPQRGCASSNSIGKSPVSSSASSVSAPPTTGFTAGGVELSPLEAAGPVRRGEAVAMEAASAAATPAAGLAAADTTFLPMEAVAAGRREATLGAAENCSLTRGS